MASRPLRFGVLSLGHSSLEAWSELARRIEDLGFDVLHVPQHLSLRVAPAMSALAIAAVSTTRLRVGTLVVSNELQHPAVVATESSWLAELTGGRFELGIGAGWLATDDTVIGRPFAPAAERVDRLEEGVEVIRRYWNDDPVEFTGRHYRVDGLSNAPPTRGQAPRLLIGGGGKRVLRIAATFADIVSFVPEMGSGRIGSTSARTATLEATRSRVEHVHDVAGSRFADLELHTMVTGVYDRDDARAERAARAYGVDVGALAEVPNVMVGDTSAIVEQVLALRAATGITFVTVPEEAIDMFAPVVAQLAGSL